MTTSTFPRNKFAERLAYWRRYKVYKSRKELAEVAGISEDLIASLEQGRLTNPTLKTLVGLARSLEMSLAELVEAAAPWCK